MQHSNESPLIPFSFIPPSCLIDQTTPSAALDVLHHQHTDGHAIHPALRREWSGQRDYPPSNHSPPPYHVFTLGTKLNYYFEGSPFLSLCHLPLDAPSLHFT